MSNVVITIKNRFDLSSLDALLGPEGFASALERDNVTGRLRYAAIKRDSFDDGELVRVTVTYALGFPGRGRRLYTLLALDVQVQDGVEKIICAKRLGRLVPAAPLADAMMLLARALATATLPNRAELTPFLPPSVLDELEKDLSATDFPEEGFDREERLPETFWDRPPVLREGKIDPQALAITLNLVKDEPAQHADLDPITADYRVFHLGIVGTPQGGETLTFELHRQGPGYELRIFNVLSLALSPVGADGLCNVEAFVSDTDVRLADIEKLLPELARIVAALQEGQRPSDVLILPLLSRPAQALWTQALLEGVAA